MDHWAKDRGVDPEKEIFMLADGECTMTKALGLSQMMPGLGERSFRYSMYLEDGVIKVCLPVSFSSQAGACVAAPVAASRIAGPCTSRA